MAKVMSQEYYADRMKSLRQTRAELKGALDQFDAMGKELYLKMKDPGDPCWGDCWLDGRCPRLPVCNE